MGFLVQAVVTAIGLWLAERFVPGVDVNSWTTLAIAAVRAGKDVYVEKPLGHTLAQNKAMLDTCVKHDRIFQYGTQQRSQEILRRGIELVLNGTIGEIERIDIWAPRGTGGGSLVAADHGGHAGPDSGRLRF